MADFKLQSPFVSRRLTKWRWFAVAVAILIELIVNSFNKVLSIDFLITRRRFALSLLLLLHCLWLKTSTNRKTKCKLNLIENYMSELCNKHIKEYNECTWDIYTMADQLRLNLPALISNRVKQNTLTRKALRSCKNQSQRIKFKASKSFQLGNGKF